MDGTRTSRSRSGRFAIRGSSQGSSSSAQDPMPSSSSGEYPKHWFRVFSKNKENEYTLSQNKFEFYAWLFQKYILKLKQS